MVVKLQSGNVVSNTKYNFFRKGGKSLIEHRPIFSPDGESLLVIVENTVRVYNIETGDCVRTLETESHTEDLIAVEFLENEHFNLYGCSWNGYVTIWTWANGAVLKETKLEAPPDMDILTFNLINSTDCLITTGSSSYKHIHLGMYSMKNSQLIYDYSDTQPKYYDMIRVSLGWYNGDRFAAVTNGTKVLFIQNLDKPHLKEMITNQSHIRIVSVDAHQGMVAITDALGRVSILRGSLFDSQANLAREVLHWHFLPVMSCTFSSQGNYLYTGGVEKVLVKWTVGNVANKAYEKQFIPRLPGIVRYIATNNTHVAATLSNNSIIIANAQMRTTCTILECGGLSPVMRALGGSLIYHSRFGGLLMPGRTGHLQMYSTVSDKVLFNIDITETNELPSERNNLLPLGTEVTCAAVSGNGKWLATSEYRNDGVNYPEEKLKFWHAKLKKHTPFVLHTCVNLSHGGCNVVALAFNLSGSYCVSAGTDQKFRVWKKEIIREGKEKKINFVCQTACYYSSGIGQFMSHDILNTIKRHDVNLNGKIKQRYLREIHQNDPVMNVANVHKVQTCIDSKFLDQGMRKNDDLEIGGVAISQDGSLIAAWFGCKLTLWDSHLCTIRTTLSHPALRPKGLQVKFGSKDAEHYLVCTSQNCLAVWSLLSLTMQWFVQLKPSCLAADRLSNKMAVVTENNDVFVFTPHSSKPIFTQKRLLNPQTGVFKQITFGAATGDDVRLFLMRNNSEIYTIEPEKRDEERLEVMTWKNRPISKFGALMAEQQLSEVKAPAPGQTESTDANANSAIAQLNAAAPHMLPPVSLFCTSFLELVCGSKETKETADDTQEETPLEVVDSSDDEDEPVLNRSTGPTPRVMELWTPNYDAVKQKKLNKIMKEPFSELDVASVLFSV